MTTIFIIHGAYSNPNENWFPWLKQELEKLGHETYVPKFPTPENQSLENWMKVWKNYENLVDESSILVGHSLGPAFILNILQDLDFPIKACFFISGTSTLSNNPELAEFDEMNKSFFPKKFNWTKIKSNCKKFHIYHSDNDPYLPIEKSIELGEHLGIKPVIIKGAGHFNEASGYTKFPKLLEDMKRELK